MYSLQTFLSDMFGLFSTIGIADIVDILLIAFILFEAFHFVRKTNSARLAQGIFVIILALWISDGLGFTVVNYFLRQMVTLGFIALLILFQPEIRRALEKIGTSRLSGIFSTDVNAQSLEFAITQTVIACSEMSKTRTGALIIFERDNKLTDPINTGTIVNADTTAELLKNIFYPKAPLHDGAVIICDNRIAAAGCMLPLSDNANLSKDLGMRHRAGIGMSEHSDAVVVIVSEETGAISVAVEGMLKRHLSPETCERLLRNELIKEEKTERYTFFSRLGIKRKVEKNDKNSHTKNLKQ
jgi:diadenylate cyclase